jgi:hypothetical protein
MHSARLCATAWFYPPIISLRSVGDGSDKNDPVRVSPGKINRVPELSHKLSFRIKEVIRGKDQNDGFRSPRYDLGQRPEHSDGRTSGLRLFEHLTECLDAHLVYRSQILEHAHPILLAIPGIQALEDAFGITRGRSPSGGCRC